MSRARLVITAVVVEGRSQSEVARAYGVSKGWVSKLVARYRFEGEAAFAPRSRRPRTSPNRLSHELIAAIVSLRRRLKCQGLDAGPDTIAWHLLEQRGVKVSSATISRYRSSVGLVTPQPRKRPRSSYVRFEASMPNETWQSDVTYVRLASGVDAKVLSWLDDGTRLALSLTVHDEVTALIVLASFRKAVARYGAPRFPSMTCSGSSRGGTARGKPSR